MPLELSVDIMLKLFYALGIGVLIGVERSLLVDSSKEDKDIFMGSEPIPSCLLVVFPQRCWVNIIHWLP